MNEFDSIKWAQQQLDNTEFRLQNFKYNQTQIDQYTHNPYSEVENISMPFHVSLREDVTIEIVDGEEQPVTTYKVTVNTGFVIERIINHPVDDALAYHLCDNFFDGGELREFTIEAGEMIAVYFQTTAAGNINGGTVTLTVVAENTPSVAATPTIISSIGEYYYKLAELQYVDGVAVLIPVAMDSHIYHPTGASKDIRFMSCQFYDNSDPPVPINVPSQLGRLTFVSGMLMAANLTELEWDPTGATVIEVRSCNSADEYSMP